VCVFAYVCVYVYVCVCMCVCVCVCLWVCVGVCRMADVQERDLEEIAERVGLTDEQKDKVRESRNERVGNLREVFRNIGARARDGGFNAETITKTLDDLKAEDDVAMKELLTPEQFEKYIQFRNERLAPVQGFIEAWRARQGGQEAEPQAEDEAGAEKPAE